MSVFDPASLVACLSRLAPVGRVWVAYSGGLDSTVLLHGASVVRERLPGPLQAVHIDHGLHQDSGDWGEHCRDRCEALAIPLKHRRVVVEPGRGESLEAVARAVRYGAFSALLVPDDLLLTAHHQDDQAETLLLALIRGSGVQGLAAMPLVAQLGPGRLVRPLLGYPRTALEQYARAQGLSWLDDPSNALHTMDRNYLRHLVLPMLRERWPAVSSTLARSASHCAEAAHLVDLAAVRELETLGGERPGTLSIPGLARIEPTLRKAVLRLWFRQCGFLVPDSANLRRIQDEVMAVRPDAQPLVAWQGCEVRRYRQDLYALRPLPCVPVGHELRWEGRLVELPHGLGRLERVPGPHRLESRYPPLIVRFGVPELVCQPPDSRHHRSLKKLFQEAGVPSWLRPYVPLLFSGGELVAVVGVCDCVLPSGVTWSGHPWESFGFFALTTEVLNTGPSSSSPGSG